VEEYLDEKKRNESWHKSFNASDFKVGCSTAVLLIQRLGQRRMTSWGI